MKLSAHILWVYVAWFANITTLKGQSHFEPEEPTQCIGIMVGYGVREQITGSQPYQYEVRFFTIQYHRTFLQKKATSIELSIQPQYNLTRYKYDSFSNEIRKGYEYGVNLGILIRQRTQHLSFYGLLSSGPHYISGAPKRQSKGFIFSDNIALGITLRLYQTLFFDFRAGFRHVSNAGIRPPNGGLNNLLFSGGFIVHL